MSGRLAFIVLALLLFLPTTPFSQSVSAATDDMNLTGLVYLSNGTALEDTLWANDTSFAIYVNHMNDWNGAWRYPSSPQWYMTSMGAYSIVLPASEKDRNWSDGDWYRVQINASNVLGTPGLLLNATSNGTGDPGEFTPSGSENNSIAWSVPDNWQRWDIVIGVTPDLSIDSSEITLIPSAVVVELVTVTVNATVRNMGSGDALDVVIRFTDGIPPSDVQIGPDKQIPLLSAGGLAQVEQTWTASPVGMHTLCVIADPGAIISELDESNNQACVPIEVLPPPLSDLIISPADVLLNPVPPCSENSTVLINATVRNSGGNASGTTTAEFHDGVPPSAQIGSSQPLGPIPSGGSQLVSISWTASPKGSHQICVVADPDNLVAESNENNNMACVFVDVQSLPDLIARGLAVAPSSPILEGTMSRINLTVSNEGDLPAGAFDVLLFDDRNGNKIPDAGEQINISSSSGITGHSRSEFIFDWNATPAGPYSICADADPPPGAVMESNETNNMACIDVSVQPGPILRSDYAPDSPLPTPPIKIGTSLSIALSIQVRNQGNGTPAGDAIIAFFQQSSPPFSTFVLNPLAPDATSSRFVAMWISPAIPGTYLVSVDVDHDNNVTEWDETNNVCTWTIEVVSGPVTSLVVGDPNYTSPASVMYLRSSTPLDLSVVDRSGTGVNHTWYRLDNVTWIEYSSSFLLSGDGDHYVEWYSEDNVGNVEVVSWRVLRVDDTPPATAISIGEPKYLTGSSFVKSSTPLVLSPVDGGVGSNSTFHRLWDGSWSRWQDYSTSFNLAGRDGTWYVEFLSFDYLGNKETVRNETLILDDTPPVTTVSPAAPFTFTATDSGCGVKVTMYRIDGGNWTVHTGGFTIMEGEHTIYYYSIDRLGNVEQERSLVVKPLTEVAVNYKPIVALVFAIILLVAGVWSSKKKPWKGGKDRMAVVKAFMITSMPFVLAEAATGIAAYVTGQLSIPPALGFGTAVDLSVLVVGLVVSLARVLKKREMEAESTNEPESR